MGFSGQSICLWISGTFGVVLAIAFLVFPSLAPMSPGLTAPQVVAYYVHHTGQVRASGVILNICGVMLIPLFGVVVYQMKRIGTHCHALAYGYLSAAMGTTTLFAMAAIFWLVAAYQPTADPQVTVLLNDLAWIFFTAAPVGMMLVQNVCLGAAVYLDDRRHPIFPRWLAPYSFATALVIAPAVCSVIFKTGPLAWDGAVSFWLRNAAYAVYLVVLFVLVRQAVRRQMVEEGPAYEELPLEEAPR